jgi:hypothetical protein
MLVIVGTAAIANTLKASLSNMVAEPIRENTEGNINRCDFPVAKDEASLGNRIKECQFSKLGIDSQKRFTSHRSLEKQD